MTKRLHVIATVGVLTGCTDLSTAPRRDPAHPGAFGVYSADYPDSVLARSELERAFLELEKAVPGFAGFYRDNGSLVLLSTLDPNEEFTGRVSERLTVGRRTGLIEAASISEREAVTRVERATFRFRDLAIWRGRIRDGIMDLPGVTTLDLDEAANRIVVGVESTADRSKIFLLIAASDVPEAAVVIKLDPEPQAAQGLDSRIRPLTAGTRLGRYNQYFGPPDWTPRWTASYIPCTLGTPALYQGAQTLLIVSHCTNQEGILENPAMNYYTYFIGQPFYPGVDGYVGWSAPAPQGFNPFGYEMF